MSTMHHNGSALKSRRAIILAGGQSRRFGSNKVYADLEGKPMLAHTIDKLDALGFDITLSGPQQLGEQFALPCISDAFPHQGPLAALYHMFTLLRGERYLVIACDTPLCPPQLLEAMWDAGNNTDILLPHHNDKPAPLPGIYSRNCLPHMEALLRTGRRDLRALLSTELTHRTLCACCTERYDPEGLVHMNVNTQQDFASISV